MEKKVLIIGNTAKEYALAKKMSETCEVYVAPGNAAISEFATCVDIREDSAQELLEFALENGIDLTVPISIKSIQTGITELFSNNNMSVFAPNKEAAKIISDKAFAKKIMYKLRIPTPKFGIFEKQAMANDYIKNFNQPFVIKTDSSSSAVILTSAKSAKPILDSVFAEKFNKVIIEDYVYGSPFAFYAVTDGYKALPLGSSILYKHSLEGEGGQLTSGMGACSPNYKISFENEAFIMNDVIYPLLDYMEHNGSAYLGIIGVNGIIAENGTMKILGFTQFMQDADCASVLELIDTDIYNLFVACVIGSFSDEIEYIPLKDMYSSSVVLNCRNTDGLENVISGFDNLDEKINIIYTNNVIKNRYLEFEAKNGAVLVLSASGRTLSSSIERVYEGVNDIKFRGMFYRKDIGNCITATV